jgi:hypothetical protein
VRLDRFPSDLLDLYRIFRQDGVIRDDQPSGAVLIALHRQRIVIVLIPVKKCFAKAVLKKLDLKLICGAQVTK